MLENLPAKRACRQIIPNITKPRTKKISSSIKKSILVASKSTKKTKSNVSSTTVTAITKNILRGHKRIYSRRLKQVCTNKPQIVEKNNKLDKFEEQNNRKDIEKVSNECEKLTEDDENNSKNVVQKIGKKAKCFVKKITQKFQKSRNSILKGDVNKNCASTKNIDKTETNSIKKASKKKGTLLRSLSFRISSKKESLITKSINDISKNADNSTKCNGKDDNSENSINPNPSDLEAKRNDISKVTKITKIIKKKPFKKMLNINKNKNKFKKINMIEQSEDTKSIPTSEMAPSVVEKQAKNPTGNKLIIKQEESKKSNEMHLSFKESKNERIADKPGDLSLDVDIQPLNLSVPVQPSLQISPTAKRRSKKLNDCIAMLTGKLQEKLGKPFFESNENLDSALSAISRQSSITDISNQDLGSSCSINIDATTLLNNEITCNTKRFTNDVFHVENKLEKSGKRKTLSRKIIKKDSVVPEINVIDLSMPKRKNNENESGNTGRNASVSNILIRPPILNVFNTNESPITGVSTITANISNFQANLNLGSQSNFSMQSTGGFSFPKFHENRPNININTIKDKNADSVKLSDIKDTKVSNSNAVQIDIYNNTPHPIIKQQSLSSNMGGINDITYSMCSTQELMNNTLKGKKKIIRKNVKKKRLHDIITDRIRNCSQNALKSKEKEEIHATIETNANKNERLFGMDITDSTNEQKLSSPNVPCHEQIESNLVKTIESNKDRIVCSVPPKKKVGRKPKRYIPLGETTKTIEIQMPMKSEKESTSIIPLELNTSLTTPQPRNLDGKDNSSIDSNNKSIGKIINSISSRKNTKNEQLKPNKALESTPTDELTSPTIDIPCNVETKEAPSTNLNDAKGKKVGKRKMNGNDNSRQSQKKSTENLRKILPTSIENLQVVENVINDEKDIKDAQEKTSSTNEGKYSKDDAKNELTETDANVTQAKTKENLQMEMKLSPNENAIHCNTSDDVEIIDTTKTASNLKKATDLNNSISNLSTSSTPEQSVVVKKRPGRKKKIVDDSSVNVAIATKNTQQIKPSINKSSDDTKVSDLNTSEENQDNYNLPNVKKTRKYTRKPSLKKNDLKTLTNFNTDSIQISENQITDINLKDDIQIQNTSVTSSLSENITFYDSLISSPSLLLPSPIPTPAESGVSKITKPSKNKRGRKPGSCNKGGKKNDNKTPIHTIQEAENIQSKNLMKEKDLLNENIPSKKGNNTEKGSRSPPIIVTSYRRSNRNKSQTFPNKNELGHVLSEVEEIVASFFTDDDKVEEMNTEHNSLEIDKPIRLDEAEAILCENDDLEENTNQITPDTNSNVQLQFSTSINKKEDCDNSSKLDEFIIQQENCDPFDALKNDKNSPLQPLPPTSSSILCKELSINLIKQNFSLQTVKVQKILEDKSIPEINATPIKRRGRKKGTKLTKNNENALKKYKRALPDSSKKIDDKIINNLENNATEVSLPKRRGRKKKSTQQDTNYLTKTEKILSRKSALGNSKDPKIISNQQVNEININLIDDNSFCSNQKFQDESETDGTRSDSAAKKQRRRRKNELAAIVADQLLESFKEVDKSKIEDLRMIENLAYEKSEDLLLTGMRLTPTTKRKIAPQDDKETTTSGPNMASTAESNNKINSTIQKAKKVFNIKGKTRNRSQTNNKSTSIKTNSDDIEKKDDHKEKSEDVSVKKRKLSPDLIRSASHENLFRSMSKIDEPLKLNVEPLSQKHNFKICSNFNTTQFEVFSTFKSSFDTFRSLTDFSFMNRKDIIRKSNFIPASAETSNSVDSHCLRLHEDLPRSSESSERTRYSGHKKTKKKLSKKKEKEKIVENENINELRSGIESFSFEKEQKKLASPPQIVSAKDLDSLSQSKDMKHVKSPIIAKSQFSFSATDLYGLCNKPDSPPSINHSKKPLLRPSMLAVTLESPRPLLSDNLPSEIIKPVSSRDPRLNKNKVKQQNENIQDENEAPYLERRRMGSIRQRRKSERDNSALKKGEISPESELNTAFHQSRERLRSSRRLRDFKQQKIEEETESKLPEPSEEDDDNYLAQIAKSVNDKIMTSEDEGDGFELTNTASALLLANDRPARPSTSMSLRSMPNFNDDQSNGEFLLDDDNTNTELIDMDLEDDISVYTSFSQDVSRLTNKGKFGHKRRRRRSLLFSRKPKKHTTPSDLPEETFNCEICNKSFRKAASLSKHQMTLTHIAKLSEHEYMIAYKQNHQQEQKHCEENSELENKNSKEKVEQEDQEIVKNNEPTENAQSIIELETEEKEPEPIEELVNEAETVAAMPVETEVPHTSTTSTTSMENAVEKSLPPPAVNLLNQSGIEPISSPEQVETNYDRYQNTSSRIALSQEERLFYECCNMLKGSETPMVERSYPIVPSSYSAYDVPNKPVTPKSSERFSYLGSEATGNFHHGTAYTVKSPMSLSRTSPRHAYPKIDVNQFSDISSDSNPAFPRSQPHPNLQSNLNYPTKEPVANTKFPSYNQSSDVPDVQTGISTFVQETAIPNYHQAPYISGESSFTPVQFPIAATEGNPASLTARTFVNTEHRENFNTARETAAMPYPDTIPDRIQATTVQAQAFTSPIHSTSSQGSTTTCRMMKTKAAMKGYDNFKVSIPTMGLDMQQALERSPHTGCKLTALAEIALGSEAPITTTRYPSLQTRQESCEKNKLKPDINEKFVKKYQDLIKSNIKPDAAKVNKRKDICEKTGNRLGFKAKKKQRTSKCYQQTYEKIPDKPKDIYEFDDSEEILPKDTDKILTKSKNKQPEEKIVIPERPFKDIGLDEQQQIKFHKPEEVSNVNEESLISSTSYSDRDDFNYGSMSDNQENEKEEGSSDSDSISSARTAKTIENKCLIVGRIFKNATKNRPEEKKLEKSPVEQKKKIPTQELDKLFDRLREIKEPECVESLTSNVNANSPKDIEIIQDKENVVEKSDVEDQAVRKDLIKDEKSEKNEGENETTQNNAEFSNARSNDAHEENKDESSQKEKKNGKKRLSRKESSHHSKEIYKLQSELGMSAEEIVELIGEGTRKSQRRCAANRPQKFVETWSSDEYEDFLSTKDIIAFIEEKEKKSRKRKSTSKSNEKKKSTDNSSLKLESCNSTTNSQVKPKNMKETELIEEKISDEKEDKCDTDNKQPEKFVDKLLEKLIQKNESSTTNKSEKSKICDTTPKMEKEKKSLEKTNSAKKPTLTVKPRIKTKAADSDSDFELELRRRSSKSKIKKRRKTISFKERSIDRKPLRKNNTNRKTSRTKSNSRGNISKLGISTEATRPLGRRKRVASEMLYYWSSSSDEEFGRIEARDDDDDDDDLTPEGEHYQQHGWIVGDSHKKLVTLLAIAKGKKVEDCGVKETVHKKKS